MTTFDRASFERFLASIYTVQKSGLDGQSLSALVALQQSITRAEVDIDRAMHMTAERAQKVANATGIAIALLRSGQLEYRACTGSAVAYVGRRVTAVLSVSAHNEARNEILRVENAEYDTRVEGAVCRLFGAKALLIVPIYREHLVAGVLEVFFSETHIFHDREVRTYRVMARLIEDIIAYDVQRKREREGKKQLATASHTVDQTEEGTVKATTIAQTVKEQTQDDIWWNVAAVGLVTVLAIFSWTTYHHRLGSRVDYSSPQRLNFVDHQIPAGPSRASIRTSTPHVSEPRRQHRKSASPAFKVVRVGPNEVDYIAEDVIIRHFMPTSAPVQMGVADKQVNFGEDVTVRYFGSKSPVVGKEQTASAGAQSMER